MQLRESRNISTKTTRLEGDPKKNLKKFAALLLVGAMALLMLTACGGGGSANKTEEQKVMEKIGSQKNVQVTNDAELRAIAEAHLDEDLKIVWKLGNHAFRGDVYVNNLGDDLVITVTAKYDYEDTLLSDILFRLSNYIDTKVDASVNQSGIWSKVGVVIKHNETQSYIGIAIRVKNPHK